MGGPMSRMAVIAACMVAGNALAQTPELLFQAEAQTLSGTCAGQPVRLEGNHNTVALAGACRSLLLKGVANTVRLRVVPGGTIHVEGSANRVSFTAAGAPPTLEALGPDNEVTQAADAAPPPPATQAAPPPPMAKPAAVPALALAGDDRQRIADCTGLDVTVTGKRSAYALQGACRSLTVQGDLLTVRADLAPGARIAITGQGNIVTWSVRRNARPPAVVVRGAGSRAQRAMP